MALLSTHRALAVLPDSPEVKAVLAKAFKYLETAQESRLGGKCLIGLCFLKRGDKDTHPQIQEAVKACQDNVKNLGKEHPDIYDTGLAIMFLCELDASRYQGTIDAYLKSLQKRQKQAGGWGYPSGQFVATCDTSMTQYGVLASWVAKRHGFVVPVDSLESVSLWLLRTQDLSGGWGYQGKDPGLNDTGEIRLVKQDSVRQGLSAAGLGSTYICADLLGLTAATTHDAEDDDLPPAVKRVPDAGQPAQAQTDRVRAGSIRAAEDRGRGWWSRNYKIEVPEGEFPYYYLYALERLQSFMELATNSKVREPLWYTDGYHYLKKTQQADGSWASKPDMVAPDTDFGILFLLRSTKKSIEKTRGFDNGVLAGGKGLPRDLSNIHVHDGQIVAKPVTGSLAALMDLAVHPDRPNFAEFAGDPRDLVRQLSEAEGAERAAQLKTLRRLAVEGPGESRQLAVDVLAQVRDFDNAPTLIAALSDSQWPIVRRADEGLREISRRVGPSSIGQTPDEAARAKAIANWRAWYAAARPE